MWPPPTGDRAAFSGGEAYIYFNKIPNSTNGGEKGATANKWSKHIAKTKIAAATACSILCSSFVIKITIMYIHTHTHTHIYIYHWSTNHSFFFTNRRREDHKKPEDARFTKQGIRIVDARRRIHEQTVTLSREWEDVPKFLCLPSATFVRSNPWLGS